MMAVASCGGNGDVGESCGSTSDCADGLQCFDHTCVPRCELHADCGDGHICENGACVLVESEIGDHCERELDCGPGQACHLDDQLRDENDILYSSCQPEVAGNVLDETCTADADCRTGTCVIGRCVDLCDDRDGPESGDDDCPADHVCARIPRELSADDVAAFYGCLPASGNIVYDVPFDARYQRFYLPVPDDAASLALVSSIADPAQLVGAARLESPSGELLYQLPLTREEYFANRVRHEPTHGISTLVLPQTGDQTADLDPGAYVVELGSYIDLETPGTEIPDVQVIYKLFPKPEQVLDFRHLDIHFYFLDLADHPCAAAFGAEPLDATTAQDATPAPDFQDFVTDLQGIFNRAEIVLETETATYADVTDRPDLDGLSADRLGELLSLSTTDGGVNVFFVRTLSPVGLQALAGGPPGPPGIAGTRASGVAIGVDTLCYRSWADLARITAHELARALGLQHNIEPDGFADALDDTPDGSDNLLYYSEFATDVLTPSQRDLVKRSPALR
jgi:hypothetical protein